MIKQKFDWDNFINNPDKIAIHCKTEAEADKFCYLMHEHGLKWRSGASYLSNTYYYEYEERIYYTNKGSRGKIDFANENNIPILSFSLFDFDEERTE